MIVDGARVRQGAKLGAGLILTATIPVIDAETGEEVARGVIPERAVVVQGTRMKEFAGGTFGLPCALDPALPRRGRGARQAQAQRDPARARHRFVTHDLLALTEELCAIPSVSGAEAALADVVEARLRASGAPLQIERIGANVVARTELGRDRADRARRPPRHRAGERQRRRRAATATCCTGSARPT